jgi:hypothetical protein
VGQHYLRFHTEAKPFWISAATIHVLSISIHEQKLFSVDTLIHTEIVSPYALQNYE